MSARYSNQLVENGNRKTKGEQTDYCLAVTTEFAMKQLSRLHGHSVFREEKLVCDGGYKREGGKPMLKDNMLRDKHILCWISRRKAGPAGCSQNRAARLGHILLRLSVLDPLDDLNLIVAKIQTEAPAPSPDYFFAGTPSLQRGSAGVR